MDLSTICLSVIIPTHKRPEMLERAVSSALATIGETDEVVVVGDHDHEAKNILTKMHHDPRLFFVVNEGERGAAATRNLGVTHARHEVILFLDDDDVLMPGYPASVRRGCVSASWGFGSLVIRGTDDVQPNRGQNEITLGDFPAVNAPFRRKLAALSAGFWVRKEIFLALGGLDLSLEVDEDTDLCCRLIAHGHQPWINNGTAVILDRAPMIPRLTNQTKQDKIAECYLRTWLRNGKSLANVKGAQMHLALRAQRMILRSSNKSLQNELNASITGWWLCLALFMKRLTYRLKSR